MLVPVRWLKDYVETTLSPKEIAHALTMVGLEVEGIVSKDPGFSGVVTARVESVGTHPNADKLSLCSVTDGKATYSVVCGASNVAPGITIALARLGASLPGNLKVKRSKIRGVESEGMICSGKELGLTAETEGIMHLPTDLPLDVPVEVALGLADAVLEVNITPNRPDCLAIVGIARELAAATGAPLLLPEATIGREEGDVRRGLAVDLIADDGCPRYCARRVTGIKVGPSPDWMARRLEAAGIRPISNVVDVTNFVMLETGHPLHAFDGRMIDSARIVVRWAGEGESLMTLDGVTHVLTKSDLLIADPKKAIALGGVMGGEHSGIADSTTDVILEAAYFDPVVVRRTAKRLRMHTESSHRFERGCDPSAPPRVLTRACQLLEQIAGGTVAGGTIDCYPRPIEPRQILVRVPRVNQILGTKLERHRIETLLRGLGLGIHERAEANLYYDPEKFVVVAPTRRPDLLTEVDVIEEVARAHGYDRVSTVSPSGDSGPVRVDPTTSIVGRTRRIMAGLGLSEAVSFPFSERPTDGAVKLSNPLKEEDGWLRTSLLESALRNLVHNLSHQNDRLELFELGRVFGTGEGTGPYHQEYRLSIMLAGDRLGHWRQASRSVDYYAMKGLVEVLMRGLGIEWRVESLEQGPGETAAPGSFTGLPPFGPAWFHPARSARIVAGGRTVGAFGELHPRVIAELKTNVPVAIAEVALERLVTMGACGIEARSIPTFPRADRDLAVIVPAGTSYEHVATAVREMGGRLLEECRLFDVFTGQSIEAGRKSLALSLSFRHADRTLTDVEIEKVVGRIMQRLERDFGARLRDR